MRSKHLYMNLNGNSSLSNEKWFFSVAFSHYTNITVVYKLCDAQIGEEIMKGFFVIHSITHHPTRKKKTTRQTESHSQFFRRSSIYTPVHILLPFDFFHRFKGWFWNWVHIPILRRPQNFAKPSPYFCLYVLWTKVRWKLSKILWPSQNIRTLNVMTIIFWFSRDPS